MFVLTLSKHKMFLRCFNTSLRSCKKYLFSGANKIIKINNSRPINGYAYGFANKDTLLSRVCGTICCNSKCQVLRCYSSQLDGDISDLPNPQKERELANVSLLYPNPRVTLNDFAARATNSVFTIHYRQSNVAPKGCQKKTASNDWICTYEFVWPERKKFEGIGRSKPRAADQAALLALHWLHVNKRIDKKGFPVYDKVVVEKLISSIEEPFRASLSEQSMEQVQKIWNEYENEIKPIYERTFSEAQQRFPAPAATLIKDSSLDEEDEYPEEDYTSSNNATDLLESPVPVHPVYGRHVPPPTETALDRRKRQLTRVFSVRERQKTPLPIDDYIEEIASTVSRSPVTVVVGAAGCGKSTRAPLAPLCAGAAILVAEPRRVAAIGLARSVASDLGEQVGETVGYQVRLDSQPPRPPTGSILFCTSGVLLRRLQSNPGLQGCTHVFIDEAHERDVNTDLSLLLLKRATRLNSELRVVVMSATLDTDVFSKYFDSCPVIEVPGRTFPVGTFYLHDIRRKYNLALSNTLENCSSQDEKPPLVHCKEIVEVIMAIDRTEPEGAILVFLPGWSDIKQTKTLLEQRCGDATHLILPVHSRLSTAEQARMFASPPPGVRKLVLATNIAETAVTIPDAACVVDPGLHKEQQLREGTAAASLCLRWVSRAAARQRAGRAGRLRAGNCYKLYTEEKENEFAPYITPEILRVPLEQTVLDCKAYAPDVKAEDFLSQLPEPPTQRAIQFAVNDLIDLGALSAREELTRLGALVARLPLAARLARGALAAAAAGALGAAAALPLAAGLEPFADAAERREEIREIKRQFSPTSDYVALQRIQEQFERVARERGARAADAWCRRYGLLPERLRYARALSNLYLEELVKSPVVQPAPEVEELNRFSAIDELASLVLLCGPNSLLVTKPRLRTKGKLMAEVRLVTSRGERAQVSSGSVTHGAARRRAALLAHAGALHSAARRALLAPRAARVSPHAVAVLCQGPALPGESYDDTTVLKLPRHNLLIHVPTRQVDHILWTKEMFANTFQYYVERDPNSVSYEENAAVSRFKFKLIKTIARILVEAHREFENNKDGVDEFR